MSQAQTVHRGDAGLYVCYSCNKESAGPVCLPGHRLYAVTSFWRGFGKTIVGLILYRLVLEVLARFFGMALHGFSVGGAGLLLLAYLLAALTQTLRGGATRLLVPQFLGVVAGSGLFIALNMLLFAGT